MNYKTSIAQIANRSGFLDLYGFVRRRLTGSQAVILLYHRVGPRDDNWSSVPVDPAAFERHLRYLAQNFKVLPLCEIAQSLIESQPLPEKTAAITFDDGYKDNYLYAYPLLKKYGLPATIYLTSGHIENDELFWWDKVSYLIEHTRLKALELPQIGPLALSGRRQKKQAFTHIRETLKTWREADKKGLIDDLAKAAKVVIPPGAAKNLFLTWREAREMLAGGIELGSHGITHANLTKLTLPSAENEIINSKKIIEEKLQTPVLSFSYPNGDFSRELGEIVKKSGYMYAAIVDGRLVNNKSNPFELPRVSGYEDFNSFKSGISGFYPDLYNATAKILKHFKQITQTVPKK
jgi:peptidoglycan/xylan/chitin deacetylase (PgdA/CDA1 family)